jgi:hypothetical protein
MSQYLALRQELKSHLIDSGLTLPTLDEQDPVLLRPVPATLVLDTLLDYMIGAGYASERKLN